MVAGARLRARAPTRSSTVARGLTAASQARRSHARRPRVVPAAKEHHGVGIAQRRRQLIGVRTQSASNSSAVPCRPECARRRHVRAARRAWSRSRSGDARSRRRRGCRAYSPTSSRRRLALRKSANVAIACVHIDTARVRCRQRGQRIHDVVAAEQVPSHLAESRHLRARPRSAEPSAALSRARQSPRSMPNVVTGVHAPIASTSARRASSRVDDQPSVAGHGAHEMMELALDRGDVRERYPRGRTPDC